MWAELAEILAKLADVYQQMLALSKNKRLALVRVQIKELETITRQEQVLLSVVNSLEKERSIILLKIRQGLDKQYANAGLSTLIDQCHEQSKEALQASHQRLKEVIASVQVHNELNTNLTTQALSAVNYQLNVLSRSSVGPTYAEGGKELVDRKKRLDFEA